MSFLNLTPFQFLILFLPLCAAVIVLYLYDRSRHRQTVSTLRFYRQITQSPVFARRRKIHQPWSLLLQLIALILLTLAIGELQLQRWALRSHDHVLMIDTSSWMNAVDPATRVSLMQEARQQATIFVRSLPPQDRCMILRVAHLATPVTPFTANHNDLEAAIRDTQAGLTALDLLAALELAGSARDRAGSAPGEIVLVGSGRSMRDGPESSKGAPLAHLRLILVGSKVANVGIRKLAARRIPEDPNTWEIGVSTRNYGSSEQRPELRLNFGGHPFGSRTLVVPPDLPVESTFRLTSRTGGLVEAVLDAVDDYQGDNHASIRLPGLQPLKVQIFTTHKGIWEPLMAARSFLAPEFKRPGEYVPAGSRGRLVILDGFRPPVPPDADSITLVSHAEAGGAALKKATPVEWNATHPITSGVRAKDVLVSKTAVLTVKSGDEVMADSAAGPVLVLSKRGKFQDLVFGFHPLDPAIRNQLAVPLLFANIVHWLAPELFQVTEINAGSPGLTELPVSNDIRGSQVRVLSSRGEPLPFTLTEDSLKFYVGQPDAVRVMLPGRELHYLLTLPEVGDALWVPPPGVNKGQRAAGTVFPIKHDLWPWLVLAGALGWMIEWMLYGRKPVCL